jgi:N-acetyl sugar amidotransferase
MDTSASGILFDALGRCNYCRNFEQRLATYQPASAAELKRRLEELVARVKADGRGKPYDCIVGISGGADSAFTLYSVKKQGLRPLAVHMDNGWNSELAVNNIENLVRKLDVDLHTHVINWNEYRRLMQAFFDADVVDVELLYDNAMLAVNYQAANKYGIKWILGGTNTTTEGMEMPDTWNWFKFDKKNILALARRSRTKIDTFPTIGTLEYVFNKAVRRVRWLPFLDYFDYFKPKCIEILVSEVGYRTYPYKHYESIFTRFYQGYILPTKFHIDKRKLHLSTLLMSGQLTRDEALRTMDRIPYPSHADLQRDIDYFVKKMGWTQEQLDEYLARPQVPHARYGTEKPLWDRFARLARRLSLVERHTTIAANADSRVISP